MALEATVSLDNATVRVDVSDPVVWLPSPAHVPPGTQVSNGDCGYVALSRIERRNYDILLQGGAHAVANPIKTSTCRWGWTSNRNWCV